MISPDSEVFNNLFNSSNNSEKNTKFQTGGITLKCALVKPTMDMLILNVAIISYYSSETEFNLEVETAGENCDAAGSNSMLRTQDLDQDQAGECLLM